MIRLSAHHQIELAPEYQELVDHAPQQDHAIRTVMRKVSNGEPLIQGDIVVAGYETRRAFPLADTYPVHFRKTYYPTCFHQHPDIEYQNHTLAAEILASPPPIGCTRTSFRSCFIPGRTVDKLSPLGQLSESSIVQARHADPLALIGFWKVLEGVYTQLGRLHASGLVHGDMVLHNVIVCTAPFGVFLVDFESARRKEDAPSDEEWRRLCAADFGQLFQEALHLQCVLGRQAGPLADAAIAAVPELYPNGVPRYLKAIEAGPRL